MVEGVDFSDQVLFIFSVLTAIGGLGCIFAAIFILPLSDKYGRKLVLSINTWCNIIYTILFVISKPLNSVIPLIIGRIIIGIPLALQANVLVYLNEITSVQMRGLVMSLGMAWFLFGFIVQNVLALEIVLGNQKYWDFIQLFSLLFLLPELILYKWIPESIGFLHNQGQDQKVSQICRTLYGKAANDTLGLDFDQKSDQNNKSIDTQHVSWSELWTNKTLLKAVIYISIYGILDKGTGVIQMSFYTTEIIRNFNFSTLLSQIFTIMFTIFRVLATVLGSWLTTKINRKLNLQISLVGIVGFNLLLFILGFIQRTTTISILELIRDGR